MEETILRPMTCEEIALTEKKMSMTLDDIIKMSKKSSFKVKKKAPQVPIKGRGLGGASQVKSAKVQKFMDSRSFLRQGVLAQKRFKFQEKHFPIASEVAKTFVATPVLPKGSTFRKPVNWRKPSYMPMNGIDAVKVGSSLILMAMSDLIGVDVHQSVQDITDALVVVLECVSSN